MVMPYDVESFANIGSGNGLVSSSCKQLPEAISFHHQWDLVVFSFGEISSGIPKTSITNASFKIAP